MRAHSLTQAMGDSGIESAEAVTPVTARRNTKAAEAAQAEAERKIRKRKTTMSCLSQDDSDDKWANKGPILLFVGLCLLIFVILCCVYGLRLGRGQHHKHQRFVIKAFLSEALVFNYTQTKCWYRNVTHIRVYWEKVCSLLKDNTPGPSSE